MVKFDVLNGTLILQNLSLNQHSTQTDLQNAALKIHSQYSEWINYETVGLFLDDLGFFTLHLKDYRLVMMTFVSSQFKDIYPSKEYLINDKDRLCKLLEKAYELKPFAASTASNQYAFDWGNLYINVDLKSQVTSVKIIWSKVALENKG